MKTTTLYIYFSFLSASLFAQPLKTYEQSIPGTAIKFNMVAIPGGTFTIGSPAAEKNRNTDEGPQRKIEISSFWIEEHEVTFAEWDAFFKNMDVPQTKAIAVDAVSRPTAQYIDLTWGMGRDPNHPANSMSQQAAIMYCKWLYQKTGFFYRLPTEAEWEYACRAGSSTDPKNIKEVAFFKDNSAGKFQKVKQLKPNAWGLYDMLGNVSEWTLDQYDASAYQNLTDGTKNPTASPASKYPRVARGGSYLDESTELRCANRIPSHADWNIRDPQIPKSRWWLTDGMFMGFRIVRPQEQPPKEAIEKFYASYLK
ncbi:MAG: SUMF1/EgtB/PvdO family nonheme iron enzyme [Cyclobacteriaceae bacterium]|nr:SUMF1/EgtB/PvdO family nonheme iron enzyme [Cyclobacteriaceae bacterium]